MDIKADGTYRFDGNHGLGRQKYNTDPNSEIKWGTEALAIIGELSGKKAIFSLHKVRNLFTSKKKLAEMLNYSFFCLFFVVFIAGCSEKDIGSCPNAKIDFYQNAIKSHLERSDLGGSEESVEVLNARYNIHLDWWVVIFQSDAGKFKALISCDGKMELSGIE